MRWAMHIYIYKVNNVVWLYGLIFQPIRILLLGYSALFGHIRMVTECFDSFAPCQVCLQSIAY